MSLHTYKEARPWAASIRESVRLRRMPPWFADPRYGSFVNDPRLTEEEIAIIERWATSGALSGPVRAANVPVNGSFKPDITVRMPEAFRIPARAVIDYQYVVLPLPFSSERWVQGVRILPSDRSVVHHAVLYVRDRESKWMREAKPGIPYAPSGDARTRSRQVTEDILAIYTPGMAASVFPEGMAKKIPSGADLVLQLHYTSGPKAASDRTSVGILFSENPPAKQILTLQMGRDDLLIPSGESNYRASVSGTLPQDALLVSLFPHMHLRGSAFEFEIVGQGGYVETLLRVKPFDFDWQLNYVLRTPRPLRKGTRLRWTGYFDNSPNNPRNPDPAAEVVWGEQSWDEMMIGFFDVAVDPSLSKSDFFVR